MNRMMFVKKLIRVVFIFLYIYDLLDEYGDDEMFTIYAMCMYLYFFISIAALKTL